MPKNFVAESLVFHWFRLSKNVKVKKLGAGGSQFSAKTVLSHKNKSFRRGTLLCFRRFWVSKNFIPKKETLRISVKTLLSHGTERLRRGTLWCVTYFGYRNVLCLTWLFHVFLSNFFCNAVPENLVGELFCVSQFFWYRKNLWIKGGGGKGGWKRREGVSLFSVKFFRLTVPKNIVGEHFCFSKGFGYRKLFWSRGEYHNFGWKICCLTVLKKFEPEHFCVSQNVCFKKLTR